MKMAKASKDDIQRCRQFFQFVEEFMEYGTHTPENDETEEESIDLTDEAFVAKLRELWGGRLRPNGVDCAWSRVVWGCDILIDNVCDPDAETLEWKPELAAKLEANNATCSNDTDGDGDCQYCVNRPGGCFAGNTESNTGRTEA